jgi:hypothetical protein
LPVHVTSIIRSLPFASQGLANDPSPVEPFGQSWGVTGAEALGAGVLAAVAGAAEATASGAALAEAAGLAAPSSLEQASSVAKGTRARSETLVFHMRAKLPEIHVDCTQLDCA